MAGVHDCIMSRLSLGCAKGTVSIVLPMAINNKAVKVAALMIPLSSSTLTKTIMISALVCNS